MANRTRLPHEGEWVDRLIREIKDAVRETRTAVVAGVDAIKHLVLCRIEGRPQRLDLELYPYLPRVAVTKTAASAYMALMSGSRR